MTWSWTFCAHKPISSLVRERNESLMLHISNINLEEVKKKAWEGEMEEKKNTIGKLHNLVKMYVDASSASVSEDRMST